MKLKSFGELLSETTDVAMKQVFGKSASELVYRLIEKHLSSQREVTGEKIEVFYAYLDKLIGSKLAQIIRATSLRFLCLKLRREYEEVEAYFSFLDELYETKFKLLAPLLKKESSACN